MQVTVNIPDELAALIQSSGLTPQSYVEHLLAEQVSQKIAVSPQLSLEEFDASLDELARYSEKIPRYLPRHYPVRAFTGITIDRWIVPLPGRQHHSSPTGQTGHP